MIILRPEPAGARGNRPGATNAPESATSLHARQLSFLRVIAFVPVALGRGRRWRHDLPCEMLRNLPRGGLLLTRTIADPPGHTQDKTYGPYKYRTHMRTYIHTTYIHTHTYTPIPTRSDTHFQLAYIQCRNVFTHSLSYSRCTRFNRSRGDFHTHTFSAGMCSHIPRHARVVRDRFPEAVQGRRWANKEL